MPRLRRLTSREVLKTLGDFGFSVANVRGSYAAKLVRLLASGERQVLTVPLQSELPAGTLRAIYRQASRFVSTTELRKGFFAG